LKCGAILFLSQPLYTAGGNIFNPANTFSDDFGKRIGGNHAFNEPTGQFKPLFGRQFEGNFGNID